MNTFSLLLVSVTVDRRMRGSNAVYSCWSILSETKTPVLSQPTSRCGKSQVERRSLFLPMWLLIPMKCWNMLGQRLPVIRQAQMGYRRRICLKRQKRSLTVRAKLKRSTPPPKPHHHHRPSIPAGRRGARAASVPLNLGQRLALLMQLNKKHRGDLHISTL